jgi:hypothetical protein
MLRAIVVLMGVGAGVAAADPVKLHGTLVEKASNQPMVGATIVAPLAGGENVVISDDNGAFDIAVAPPTTTLTIYYGDTTAEHVIVVAPGATEIDAGTIAVAVVARVVDDPFVCSCELPMIDVDTALETTISAPWPASRARDATSIAALAAAAPGQQTTRLDGNRRLGGAPGIALGLLQEVDVYTMRGADSLDQASDGIALATPSGANDSRGAARIALGTDGAELEAGAGGPIVVDHAWWWAGAVRGPDAEQELARVDYSASWGEQGDVVALHQSAPATITPRALGSIDTTDDYGAVAWMSKLDDAKLQLQGGASGERLDDGAITTRGAAHASIVRRQKLAGYHQLRASGEVGGGHAGGVSHRDASASLGDDWQVRPNITIDAGARCDERWFGRAHAEVWQPHATLGYDWTDEGSSQVFVAADRASLLDIGAIGGWLTAPRSRDDVLAGVTYEVAESWVVTVAARTSELAGTWRSGADVAVDHRGRIELHVTASSVEHAVAGYAALKLDAVRAGASARWAPEPDDLYGSQAGAFATWHRALPHGMATDLGAEAIADRQGELARVVVGFAY